MGRYMAQADHRQVVILRSADIGGLNGLAGVQTHLNAFGTLHHVKIGHDVAILIPEKTRASPLPDLAGAEKAAHGVFSENIGYRGGCAIKNGNRGFFKIG